MNTESTSLKLDEQCCENCRYWCGIHDQLGECRRYPPVEDHAENISRVLQVIVKSLPIMMSEQGERLAVELEERDIGDVRAWHPMTTPDEWCGEWKPQPEGAA